MNKESKSDLKIIFLGTPMFAVASLDILVKNNYDVVAVITAPDKPAGRGQAMHQPDVKVYALQKNIHVFQPEKLSDPAFLEEIYAIKADLQIVVAFRMMPEKLWNMPRLGTFNLHASLLPQYRGAAPINHAIINGEKETGVTTFFLKHEIDTGDILFQEKISIGENETAGELHDRLMMTGARLVLKTTEHIHHDDIKPVPQQITPIDAASLKSAPKIYKNDCRVNWSLHPHQVHNQIRGLSPHPAAWTELVDPNGQLYQLKIFRSAPVVASHDWLPGMMATDRKTYLHVFCTGGYLDIHELQLAGKKRMNTGDLLRGFQMNEEWRAG